MVVVVAGPVLSVLLLPLLCLSLGATGCAFALHAVVGVSLELSLDWMLDWVGRVVDGNKSR